MLSLIGLGIICILELLIYIKILNPVRKYLAVFIIFLLSIFNGLLLGSFFTFWTVLILLISGYRVFNLLRLIENRINKNQLINTTFNTSIILILIQFIIVDLVEVSRYLFISYVEWLYFLSVINLGVLLFILYFCTANYRKALINDKTNKSKIGTPSVSICIPARNETYDLEKCLDSLVRSNYPKLEILVLDDCSQNKRTSEIIKQYAYEGVRFISGKEANENWTSKNFAYEQLSQQSNGEVLLFCGVDTRFAENTITEIINYLQTNDLDMLSVMPINEHSSQIKKPNLLIQPVRYAWEIALPRNLANRPPVLSTCWLIRKTALKKVGGFKAVTHKITPESYFAKQINKMDKYKFIVSSHKIGLSCAKAAPDQYDTAIRTRYPQMHKRPEVVCLLSLSELYIFVSPIFFLVFSLLEKQITLLYLSMLCVVVNLILYMLLIFITYRKDILAAVLLQPLAALLDIFILNYSMWRYEFKQVIWKGRNICYPVMKAKIST